MLNKMSFFETIKFYYRRFFVYYFKLSGRARRAEYWWLYLFNFLISIFALCLFVIPIFIWSLAIFIPSICLSVRRFHDRGISGWWYLMLFIPFFLARFILAMGRQSLGSGIIFSFISFVSFVIMLIILCLPSQRGENEYGFSPIETEEIFNRFKSLEAVLVASQLSLKQRLDDVNMFAITAEIRRIKMRFEDLLVEGERSSRMMILHEIVMTVEKIRLDLLSKEDMLLFTQELEILENELRALPSQLLS